LVVITVHIETHSGRLVRFVTYAKHFLHYRQYYTDRVLCLLTGRFVLGMHYY